VYHCYLGLQPRQQVAATLRDQLAHLIADLAGVVEALDLLLRLEPARVSEARGRGARLAELGRVDAGEKHALAV